MPLQPPAQSGGGAKKLKLEMLQAQLAQKLVLSSLYTCHDE